MGPASKIEFLSPALPSSKYFAAGGVWEMVRGESQFHVAGFPQGPGHNIDIINPDPEASHHIFISLKTILQRSAIPLISFICD